MINWPRWKDDDGGLRWTRAGCGPTVGTPSVGVPVVLGIYLYHGFSCAYVCETALHWQKAWTSARGVRTLARDGARAVRLRQRPPPAVRPS